MRSEAASSNDVVVLIPIYRSRLEPMEQFSLDHSIPLLNQRDIRFIGPLGLDTTEYRERYPHIGFDAFEPEDFESIPGYNRLLLSQRFHQRFAAYEFMLILQTDAIVLRDELTQWTQGPYDYVGAPWPDPVQIHVNLDSYAGQHGRTVRALVGNGGLSLRRIAKCQALLEEFPQAHDMFVKTGSSEDLFFSVLGQLSSDFVLPNERIAARFSRELQPARYHAVDPTPPMGGHAWWKYDLAYWRQFLSDAPSEPDMQPPPSMSIGRQLESEHETSAA
jgi:Protein of unknown function (DUF5672)